MPHPTPDRDGPYLLLVPVEVDDDGEDALLLDPAPPVDGTYQGD